MDSLEPALLPIFVGVVTGLISAYLFTYLIYRIHRPTLEIGAFVAHRADGDYAIKVVNNSRHPIIDIRARLTEIRPKELDTGAMKVNYPIRLKNPDVFMLERSSDNSSRHSDPENAFAWRFKTSDDLETRLKNGATIRLQLISQNDFSNTSGVQSKTYTIDDLKEGNYKVGRSLEVA